MTVYLCSEQPDHSKYSGIWEVSYIQSEKAAEFLDSDHYENIIENPKTISLIESICSEVVYKCSLKAKSTEFSPKVGDVFMCLVEVEEDNLPEVFYYKEKSYVWVLHTYKTYKTFAEFELINKLFAELSHFTTVTTPRERALQQQIYDLKNNI